MLEPDPEKRCDIESVLSHPWIANNEETLEKFTEVEIEENLNREYLEEIAEYFKIPCAQVKAEIRKKRYGSVGGFYNIKKFQQNYDGLWFFHSRNDS